MEQEDEMKKWGYSTSLLVQMKTPRWKAHASPQTCKSLGCRAGPQVLWETVQHVGSHLVIMVWVRVDR